MVSGVECVLIAHDPTVRGGAMNPYTLRKTLRALEIARRNRLPVINLVESGGADLPTQSDLFVSAGKIFHDLTELSATGIATIALVFGNSTAGGAYVPGMCDYAVLVDRQAKVFLGGPPLVKMATGEDADDEALGGARHALAGVRARRLLRRRTSSTASASAARSSPTCTGASWGPAPTRPADEPLYDPDELLGIVSADFRVPFDPREVLARVVDGSRFGEYKAALRHQPGHRLGVGARLPGRRARQRARRAVQRGGRRRRLSSSCSPTRPTRRWSSCRTPPATWSAPRYEQGGIIKDGAKMINAVTNSTVPHLTVNMAASFGAGNYGMSGRAYDPRLMFAWANAKLAVMGAAAAGRGAVDRRPGIGRRPPGASSTPTPTSGAASRSRRRSSASRTRSSSPPGSTTTA